MDEMDRPGEENAHAEVNDLIVGIIDENPSLAAVVETMDEAQRGAVLSLAALIIEDLAAQDVEYFCPNCNATLDEQEGFDPTWGSWQCTSCGAELFEDESCIGNRYPGIFWHCDQCDALLNEQEDFDDTLGEWTCGACGHTNTIAESEILPGCSGDYTLLGVVDAMITKPHSLPPTLAKRQIELLRTVMPTINLSSQDASHWESAAEEVREMLETSGRNDDGVPNSVGIICQSILFVLQR